ncbi:MAG: hypothetical protein AAFV38_07180, partial [Pseudomonadota bacterium]
HLERRKQRGIFGSCYGWQAFIYKGECWLGVTGGQRKGSQLHRDMGRLDTRFRPRTPKQHSPL